MSFNLIPPFVVRRDTIDTVAYAGFEIMAGDIVKLRDQAHTDYPIEYTFSEAMTVPATGGIQGSIKNPYQSRLFVTAVQQQYSGEYFSKVFMTSNATDFRKVGGNAGNGGDQRDDRRNANHDAQHRQEGAHFVAADGLDGHFKRLVQHHRPAPPDFRTVCHPQCG